MEAALKEPLKLLNAKHLALARDNYRCLLAQNVDDLSIRAKLTQESPGERWTHTELAHIFGQSDNEEITTHVVKREWVSTAAAIVQQYADISILNELSGQDINCAENVLTLGGDVHYWSDALRISFEPVQNQLNVYKVHTHPDGLHKQFRILHEVTFNSGINNFALPDPRYLKLHHVCARVLDLSGAAEVLAKIYREMEELMDVLAEDRPSADYLNAVIQSAARRGATVF